MPPRADVKRRQAHGMNTCPNCGKSFNVRGYGMHQKACKTRQEDLFLPLPSDGVASSGGYGNQDPVFPFEDTDETYGPGGPDNENCPADPDPPSSQRGDIQIEYHPHSNRDLKVMGPEEFKQSVNNAHSPEPPIKQPWLPFRSKEDFEFAEIAHDAAMNRPQINNLLQLFHRCQQDPGKVTFQNYQDLKESWEDSSKLLTDFKVHNLKLDFEGTEHQFETRSRPMWGWITDHLMNPELVRQFEWDAHRVRRFDGDQFTRVFTEPWTGDQWWEVQSSLPENASMVCLELYADKTVLSSFGSTKAYPVMARIANLPAKIRHGEGVGGTQIVGWLPVVDDTPDEKGRPSWANFKRVVWHECIFKLLESMESYSKVGCWVECGDGMARHIFPLVLILAADLEEQAVMSLTRGPGSLIPCPRCLVGELDLWDPSLRSVARTPDAMQAILKEANGQRTAAKREELLKSAGLRNSENVFWKIGNSDPYAALSFDRLHTFPGGLFRKYLWTRVQEQITELGRDAAVEINQMAESVPRWSGLDHFSDYIEGNFMDGSKWENMSKICVHVARNVFAENPGSGDRRILLLQCIRAYVELDILASFELHTDHSIARGTVVLKRFADLTEAYAPGEWNFPKMHMGQHLFDDIVAKGVTRNYSTKPFEKMHGPLKESYLRRTNFKNFGGQILRANHWAQIAALIRSQIKLLDAYEAYDPENDFGGDGENREDEPLRDKLEDGTDEDVTPSHAVSSSSTFRSDDHFILGSHQGTCTIKSLLEKNRDDAAFTSFCSRVSIAIKDLSPADAVVVDESHKVGVYRFIRVYYESMVDWSIQADLLRCNPKFWGRPRYDFVMVNHPSRGQVFAKLVCLFTSTVSRCVFPLALVQALDRQPRSGTVKATDKKLTIYRWNLRPRNRCEIIPVRCVVRGALLVPDKKYAGDHFVIDTIDADMFLRSKLMHS